MTTDYKRHGTRHEKKSLPGFIWFTAGLSIGLFVAFLIYLDGQPKSDTGFVEAMQEELEKIKPESTADSETKTSKPRFNFYTILPELEVLIPESEIRPPDSTSAKGRSTAALSEGKQYILQAGSFKNETDAEKRKASLALLGMEAKIQRVTVNDAAWHRVRIGPYSNTRDLYRNLNQLQQHGIQAMAMELKQD